MEWEMNVVVVVFQRKKPRRRSDIMQMKVIRCRLCGEAFIGEETPTHCPFCGAPSKYMMPAEKWVKGQDEVKELSEQSKKSLEDALKTELSATGFYQAASKATQDQGIFAMFKRLSKVELEHAKTISKVIKPSPWEVKEEPIGPDQENIENAIKREKGATKIYGQALAQATEPRVREIFQILLEVEATHTNLLESIEKK